jgi:hypothetical protein
MPRRANPVGLIACLIVILSAPACGQRQDVTPPPPSSPASESSNKLPAGNADNMMIRSAKSVRWSKNYDAETIRELKNGQRQLALVVKSYEPPSSGSEGLVVHLVTANGTKRRQIHRIAIFPDMPFRVSDGAAPQRFSIPLEKHSELLEDSQINLEVGFDSSSGKLKGGLAEIDFELVGPK